MDPGAKCLFRGPKGPLGPLGPERSDFFKGPKGPKGPSGPERPKDVWENQGRWTVPKKMWKSLKMGARNQAKT